MDVLRRSTKAAGLRDGSKKEKVVEVHRARQHVTGIVADELLSVQNSAGRVISSTRVNTELSGRRPRISHGTNAHSPRTILLMKTPFPHEPIAVGVLRYRSRELFSMTLR